MSILGLSLEVYLINILIAIPIYYLLKWLFKKLNISKKLVQILTFAGTILITPMLYMLLIFSFIFYISYYPNKDFNQKDWLNNPTKRYEMTNDIINSNLLIGKTKSEVIELLGSEKYEYNDDHWGYNLGYVPGLFSIDPDVLDIYFQSNRVIKVDQHET